MAAVARFQKVIFMVEIEKAMVVVSFAFGHGQWETMYQVTDFLLTSYFT